MGGMKTATRLLVSAACSVLVLGLLLSLAASLGADVNPGDIVAALRGAVPLLVGTYALCQLGQALARAQRARVLLRASLDGAENGAAQQPEPPRSRVPGLFRMLLVTFVRGACADMLPARIGELSYVAMLNRGCAVPAADCLSSLSIGLLFDFLALLAVLAVAVPAAAQGLSLVGSMVVLATVCAAGVALLFFALPVAAAWKWERFALFRWRPAAALVKLARDVATAVVAVRRGRVAGRVLALSLGVRAAKYAGLYALFLAVTRPLWPELSHAPVSAVLVALIAAEGAASLPVPTFLSFGSYEAGGLAALTALGFPAGDSLVAMTAMHLLSQVVDYSLGGLAFLVFSWCAPGAPEKPDRKAKPIQHSAFSIQHFLPLVLSILFLFLSLLFAAWQARAIRKRGRLTAPPKGEAVEPTAAEAAARDAMMRVFGGRIVWSSNRSGLHDLWILDGPGAQPRRLTRSGYTDTYPRFSPDGTKVCFSRSKEPWVSQRNFDKWDTWVLDLATGEERLVATNAYQASWCAASPYGSIATDGLCFVRDGSGGINGARRLFFLPSPGVCGPGDEEELALDGAQGAYVTLPDARDFGASDLELCLTLRGARRATVRASAGLYEKGPYHVKDVAGGCQMVFRGPNGAVAWIDHPGRMKNAIYALDNRRGAAPYVLLDAPEPWSHEYFPRFAADGRWLVYGASTGGHEQDSADYEIFLWDTADTNTPPARLTFHTGNDCWPDVFPAPAD